MATIKLPPKCDVETWGVKPEDCNCPRHSKRQYIKENYTSPKFMNPRRMRDQRARSLRRVGYIVKCTKTSFTKAFPERYGLLVFKNWDEYSGFYELADVQHIVRFDIPNQHTAVAYPLERTAQIPRKNLPE